MMSKAFIPFLILFIYASIVSQAQDTYDYHYGNTHYDARAFSFYRANEYQLSWGMLPTDEFKFYLLKEHTRWTSVSNTGNFYLTFRHYYLRNICWGIAVGYHQWAFNYSDPSYSQNPQYRLTRTKFSAAFEVKKRHIWGRRYQIYSLLGACAAYYHDVQGAVPNTVYYTPQPFSDIKGGLITAQLTPLGISLGNMLTFNTEIGIGYKGLVNLGCSYVVPDHKHDLPRIEKH